MSEIHSFYLAPGAFGEPLPGARLRLEGQESRHLASVLRLRAGTEVRVLDGEGREARARVLESGKRESLLEVLSLRRTPRPLSRAVVALALSKAVRSGFFFEKAVELGAAEVWLWRAERSQGRLPESVREAWQAKMAAGSKQSGNPWMPLVRAFPEGVSGVVEAAAPFEGHVLPWEAQEGVEMLGPELLGRAGTTIYVIGPEGGFSPSELEALRGAGYQARSLGRRVLRCETAATLCLGLHWWSSELAARS